MQTRMIRARGIAAVGLLTALASCGALAQTPDTHPETSLLGVRLLASYNDVLSKFGQPNEIQVGDPTVSGQGQLASNTGASSGGGMPGMGGGRGGYPGMGGGRGGFPGMGGGGMMPGKAGGMMPGRAGGMAGGPPPGMAGGAPMGMPGMMPGKGGGLPGMGGPMGSSGGYPGMGGTGYPGMGGGSAGGSNTVEDSGETTWWYHFPHQGLHYSFLFNKEGRVIQIQAYGQQPAPKIVAPRTARGITLGTDFGQVIRKYGWSNDGEHSGNYVVMRYGKTDRIAFQSRNNRVLGIVLGRVKPETAQPRTAGMTGGYPGSGYPGGTGGYPGGTGGSAGGGDE